MPTNVNTAVSPSIQPAGRTTGAKTDRIVINKDGGSGSAFAKQTEVKFTNSVDNMSAVLDKIANSRLGADAVLPRQLQQMINNVVRNAFSLENSLGGGLGSALSSERYSMEQLTTLGRIFQQLGSMAEVDAAAAGQLLGTQEAGAPMAGELTDALQILMANIKNIIGESALSGNTGDLNLVQLNKLAFQLLNGGSPEGLPEDMAQLLQQLSSQLAAGQTGGAAQQGSEETGLLKQLIDVLFPKPLTSTSTASGAAGSNTAGNGGAAGGTLNTSDGAANANNNANANANANANTNTNTNTNTNANTNTNVNVNGGGNANANANANVNTGTGANTNANANAGANSSLNTQQGANGQAAGGQGANAQTAAGQGANGNISGNVAQGQVNAGGAGGANTAGTASNANNANNANNAGGPQGGAGADGKAGAARGEQNAFRPDGNGQGGLNVRGSTMQQVSELERNPLFRQIFNRYGYTQETGVMKNPMQSQQPQAYTQLANNQQMVTAFKDMAQLLLKDSSMSAKDVQLLQDFVNGSQEALSRQDAKQLNLLLRMVQSNIPAAVQQAGQQQGMDGLPKLWAFLQLAELGTLKNIRAKDLKRASKEVKTVVSSMKGAVSSEGSYRADGQKSISFVMPLYIGENEQSYPAYINLYDEQPHEDEKGRMRKDTWFRVCVLTENIGAVDIVCQLYEGNNLNLRIQFSDPEVVRDFGEYLPEIRKALYDTPIHLNDLKVGMVK